MILDDVLEKLPDFPAALLDLALGVLDVRSKASLYETANHERLEQFECHLLWESALVNLELRSNDYDRAAGVVNALSEQILAETSFLAAQKVSEALQGSVACTEYCLAYSAVVDQSVHALLKHTFFVADYYLRSVESL